MTTVWITLLSFYGAYVTVSAARRQELTPDTDEITTDSSGFETLEVPVKAIAPECTTTHVPTSSSCHIGVHALTPSATQDATNLLEVTIGQKAIEPGCKTYYSISTTCHAGVHPQPTFEGTLVTVTETSSPSTGGQIQTSVVTTTAEISVSAPSAAAIGSGDYTYYITPELRGKIVDMANSFCPAAKAKRGGGFTPRCRLPLNARPRMMNLLSKLFGGVIAMEPRKDLTLASGFVILGAYIKFITNHLASGQAVPSSHNLAAEVVNAGQGKSGSQEEESSSTRLRAPTLYPGPPYTSVPGPNSADVAALTSYWNNQYKITITATPKRPLCTHGADPQVHSGAAGYCQCTDGRTSGIYPTSRVKQTTTIDGTITTYNDDCPYTTIPEKTADRGPTIVPTVPNAPPQIPTHTPTCHYGPKFKYGDVTNYVSAFCRQASTQGWQASYDPLATALTKVDGQFYNGQAGFAFTDVVALKETNQALHFRVAFNNKVCDPNKEHKVQFRDKEWCKSNFLQIVNHCNTQRGPQDRYFWKQGGMMYGDCMEWYIGSSTIRSKRDVGDGLIDDGSSTFNETMSVQD